MNLRPLLFFLLLGTCYTYARPAVSRIDTLPVRDSIRLINLREVKVIAQENRSVSTSSVIGNEAIRHVQPFTLSGLMQLLPGGTTTKTSFANPSYFTIRHLDRFPQSNALGTGINIDGVRVTTNTDLQQLPYTGNGFMAPNGASGPDTRSLTIDNIESVEVIRGIPSVRYGDITSGMVIINTRKNLRPYSANIRLTPGIKSFSVGKGWSAGKDGVLNLSAGYTRSTSNISNQLDIFNRFSFQTGYFRNFNRNNRPLYIEAGVSGDITKNPDITSQVLKDGEFKHTRQQALRVHLSGKWTPERKLLTSIDWKTSATYTNSETATNLYIMTGYTVGTDATEEKEQTGFFIPPQYFDYQIIKSQPLSVSGALNATLRKSASNWRSITTAGIEWNSEGNFGQGKTKEFHDPTLPRQGRYIFRDLPFLHHYAAYIEENIRVGNLEIEGGVRIVGISVGDLSFKPAAEPRLNLRYTAIRRINRSGLRNLELRGGVGLLKKIPTYNYLFSEPQHQNFVNYRYRDEESGKQLAVITTAVSRQAGNGGLQPAQNFKAEAGFIALINGFSVDVTGFYEQLRNGFSSGTDIRPFAYRNYTANNDKGLDPEYHNGEVFLNGQPVGYTTDTTFVSSSTTGNNYNDYKGGIEFIIRTDYIPTIATTFVLNGAWMLQQTQKKGLSPTYIPQISNNKSYPMCGFYDDGMSATRMQKFTTTLQAITEIPALRLTTTVALQTVWTDRTQTVITDNPDNRYYMKDNNGQRIEGDLAKDDTYSKYQDPAFYMDTRGQIHRFTPELADNPAFSNMVRSYFNRKFLQNSYSPYFLLNLRVSKDIGNHLCIAFFANNLAGMHPKRYEASSDKYVEMNPAASFGAELQIRL